MEITEVNIKLIDSKRDRLQAFCSITFDNQFVIRDLKIIEGAKGPFVAMPSRKIMERCGNCGAKNHIWAKYCNECGTNLASKKRDVKKRTKIHTDIAHPINSECREMIQQKVLQAFEEEKKNPRTAPSEEEDDDRDE